MEEEGDLRTYINVLMRHWRVIAAVTLLAGVVALAVSYLSPTQYQATAVALVTGPLYQFRFSNEIENQAGAPSMQASAVGKAALDLANSDAILQQIMLEVGDDLPVDRRNLASFRKMLAIKSGSDPSIIRLSVTGRDPQLVAQIANIWAGLYVRLANDLYGKSDDQLGFFEGQLAQAKTDLDAADQALIEFSRRSDLAVLEAQLSAKENALADYLELNESLVLLQQNMKDLQAQLARRPADSPSNLGDDLAQLMLQINAFSTQSTNPEQSSRPVQSGGLPIQLQVPGASSLSDSTVGQQAAYLADLARTVETKQAEVKRQAEALPAEIKVLQWQVQVTETEAAQLTRERDLAVNVYTTLAQKVKETEISAQDGASGSVRLASTAAAPDRPLSRKLLTNTALALVLGLMAAAMGVLIVEYFRDTANMSSDLPPEHASAEERLDR